jgi:hypothetical protein
MAHIRLIGFYIGSSAENSSADFDSVIAIVKQSGE